MSCSLAENNNVQSSRKRKRENEKHEFISATGTPASPVVACFTNAAFSSTPKLIGRRRSLHPNKENQFLPNPCLEVKSIADIVLDANAVEQVSNNDQKQSDQPINPFEVVRKPPKKKKREVETVEACFENPALNLELPEKQFNPFEVQRAPPPNARVSQSKCFVNAALNLRGQEETALCNPFEIHRCSAASAVASNPTGVVNLGMEEKVPTTLRIGLPFAPVVGCRIDFNNLLLSELSPSKLLTQKLAFSPVPIPKRSLGSTGEESTMDIGKELDLYQLELENSINEAKLKKTYCHSIEHRSQHIAFSLEQKITFSQKLTEIAEADEDQDKHEKQDKFEKHDEQKSAAELVTVTKEQKIGLKGAAIESLKKQKIDSADGKFEDIAELGKQNVENAKDITYASNSDDEENASDVDFMAPAPFIRAYRGASPKLTVSKQSLHANMSDEGDEGFLEEKKRSNMKSIIRKSIRKLMHPIGDHAPKEKIPEKPHNNILASIRYSLRRKPTTTQPLLENNKDGDDVDTIDISIIDTSERTMKLKSNDFRSEDMNIKQVTNEKKHSLRNSIRRSTRGMRQQLMKTVFHKNQEDYTLQ